MGKLLLLFAFAALAILPSGSAAQTKEETKTKEPATKLEAFLAKKGRILVKDFYNLGELAGRYGATVTFDALVMSEPGQESQRIRGFKVEIKETNRIERSNTSFLDLDEAESLSRALEYMSALSAKWQDVNKEYTEVAFSTKGDFNLGFYQQSKERAAFASSGYVGKTQVFFSSMEDLQRLKSITDKGLAILREK